jgi:glycosyltransferase involved in cell wall biosynthesis
MNDGKFLALVPCYNEGDLICEVVHKTKQYLPVLVVNDGSSDQSPAVAEQAGAIMLHQIPNQGKGAALRKGFEYALENGYEAVITLDADGQHNPDEIPIFIEKYRNQLSDLIIGARNFSDMPFTRRVANTLGRLTFSWALRQPVKDNQSGYRLLSKRLIPLLLSSSEQGFEFEVEMIVTCLEKDLKLDWVEIETIYGEEESHINPIRHTLEFFRILSETRKRTRGS